MIALGGATLVAQPWECEDSGFLNPEGVALMVQPLLGPPRWGLRRTQTLFPGLRDAPFPRVARPWAILDPSRGD